MVRVSAVIPTYNRAEYVEGAIETVLDQTYEDIEAVVVNDGSTDGTRETLRRYEDDDRVQVIHREENEGIAAARNRGTEIARGEFISVLDDDDRWHPEKTEKQVALLDDLDDRYAVVYTWGDDIRDGEIAQTHRYERVGDIYPKILASYLLNPHSGHMVRKSHLKAVGGYDTDLDSAIDWDVCMRLARRYRFECVPEVLVTRYLHDGNVSLQPSIADSDRRLLDKHRDEISHYPALEHKLEARWRQAKALTAIERGDPENARRYSWSAFRHEPTAYRAQVAVLSAIGPKAYRAARRIKRTLASSALGG